MKPMVFNLIRILFTALGLCWLAPAILPGLSFHGSLFTMLVSGAALSLVYYGLRHGLYRALNLGRPGAVCPTKGAQLTLIAAFTVGTSLFVAAFGWLFPSVLTISGFWSVCLAGPLVLFVVTLSNFPTSLLDRIWADGSE